jgi:outer membrane receptor for ferrienterochelin and colicin
MKQHLLSIFLFSLTFIILHQAKSFSPDSLRTNETTTLPDYTMDAIVVTAERIENKLANTTSSSSLLLASDIQQIPTNKFSDIFNAVPGFLIFKKDGMGRDAIISTRGFFGDGTQKWQRKENAFRIIFARRTFAFLCNKNECGISVR